MLLPVIYFLRFLELFLCRKRQIPLSDLITPESCRGDTDGEEGTESEFRFPLDLFVDKADESSGNNTDKCRNDNSLCSEERAGCEHQERVAQFDSAEVFAELLSYEEAADLTDDEERDADDESADDAAFQRNVISQDSQRHSQEKDHRNVDQVDLHGVPVDEGDDNEHRHEKAGYYGFCIDVKHEECQHIKQARQRLNDRVARRDLRSAGVAFAPESEPAEYWDQIHHPDLSAAGHTVT